MNTIVVCALALSTSPVCNDLSMTETDGVVYPMNPNPCEGRSVTIRDSGWMTLAECQATFCHGTFVPPCNVAN